jgi:predicted esterase
MTPNPHAHTPLLHAGAPLADATLAVVLLHGRGASAEDILGLAPAFDLPNVAYLAPQAAGHTWYPNSFLAPREANEPYLTSALTRIDTVVRSIQDAGIPRERIVLAGFSQGACLSTEFVATHPARYAALLAFTGGLIGPPGSIHQPGPSTVLAGTPALLLSGDPDPHVPFARVEESNQFLTALGASVEIHRYPGRPHTISHPELALARALLLTVSAQASASAR